MSVLATASTGSRPETGGWRACLLPAYTAGVLAMRAAGQHCESMVQCEVERGATAGKGGMRGRGRCLAGLPRRAGAIWPDWH
jgi:hypothetical protein